MASAGARDMNPQTTLVNMQPERLKSRHDASRRASPPRGNLPAPAPASPLRILARFPRDETTQIWLTVGTFKGVRQIGFRQFFKTTDGKWLPTRRGLNFRANELRELRRALDRVGGSR